MLGSAEDTEVCAQQCGDKTLFTGKKQPHVLDLMPNLQEGMDYLEFVIAVLAKFVTVLLNQELYKPGDLVRESGDFVVMSLMVCL